MKKIDITNVPDIEEKEIRHHKRSPKKRGKFGIERTLIFFGKTWTSYEWYDKEIQRDQSFKSRINQHIPYQTFQKVNRGE